MSEHDVLSFLRRPTLASGISPMLQQHYTLRLCANTSLDRQSLHLALMYEHTHEAHVPHAMLHGSRFTRIIPTLFEQLESSRTTSSLVSRLISPFLPADKDYICHANCARSTPRCKPSTVPYHRSATIPSLTARWHAFLYFPVQRATFIHQSPSVSHTLRILATHHIAT